jgi:protein tyrosine/serine phosphatase
MRMEIGIPNLFAVEQELNLWRGGDPTLNGWLYLKDLGITTVIKLNTASEGSDAQAEVLGVAVFRFPIPWWRQVLLRPSQRDLKKAVALMTRNVLVHCERGEDRTGLVVGCFRLSQGWSKVDAYSEMKAHNFHEELQGLQGRWNTQREEDWKHE